MVAYVRTSTKRVLLDLFMSCWIVKLGWFKEKSVNRWLASPDVGGRSYAAGSDFFLYDRASIHHLIRSMRTA